MLCAMVNDPTHARTPRLAALWIFMVALAAWLTLPAAARAQYNEYKLGPDGQWVQTGAADPDSPQAVLAQARRDLAEDRPEQARTVLTTWINQYERTGSEYLPEALQLRGDALTLMGNEYDALYDYERVIKEFTGSGAYVTCVERELDIGVRYVNNYKRKFFGMRILNSEDVGEELLIRVQERMPGSRLGERAGIELADYYYRTHDLSLATEAYDLFLKNYPSSQYRMKAMQRRVYATIARYKGPRYDGSALLDSVVLIRRFRNQYPAQASQGGLDDALLARIDESIAAEMYESARWYLKQGDEPSARYLLQRLVRERPRTAAAGQAYDFMKSRGWLEESGADAPKDEPSGAQTPGSGPGSDAGSGEGHAADHGNAASGEQETSK